MPLALESRARARFAALIARDPVPLDEAVLAIAEEEYPDLDPAASLRALDRLAERVSAAAGERARPVSVLRALRSVLADDERFRGNPDHYYDPRNSFLNEVLERRLGIPITLSIVYLEVARRVGLRLEGVGFPGHFLVRSPAPNGLYVADPFEGKLEEVAETAPLVLVGEAVQCVHHMALILRPRRIGDLEHRLGLVLGLLREVSIAFGFGATWSSDTYFVAILPVLIVAALGTDLGVTMATLHALGGERQVHRDVVAGERHVRHAAHPEPVHLDLVAAAQAPRLRERHVPHARLPGDRDLLEPGDAPERDAERRQHRRRPIQRIERERRGGAGGSRGRHYRCAGGQDCPKRFRA